MFPCRSDYLGSSPHTWGIHWSRRGPGRFYGSSPHTWGIRSFGSGSLGFIAVHPHIRGAYRCLCDNLLTPVRFIPTYVGHTENLRVFSLGHPVHPHIRGAYALLFGGEGWQVGSSPHTWGIRCPLHLPGTCTRFIPTYVGHTISKSVLSAPGSVHPHIRGAYVVTGSSRITSPGSSPHTWGIPWT